ncbi:hypothetical protein [Kluyvera sichuanensis]
MKKYGVVWFVVVAALMLTGCASKSDWAVYASAPGFLHGLWHGFIAPLALIGHLFDSSIAVYSVPNNGGWYDFGFLLGVGAFGGTAGTAAR